VRRPGAPPASPGPVGAGGGLASILCLCLLLCVCAGDGPPPDRIEDRKEYYAVDGASGQELRWALSRLGPANDKGTRVDALTRWEITYTFGHEERRGRCRLGSFETSAVITMVLPRWTPGAGASPALVKRWDEYVACAGLHENGHRAIYLDGIAGLRRRATALGDFPTCEAVTAALEETAQGALHRIQDEQEAYEERSDHGTRQCGHFP
jgi:predicted secreted Zn-dependent protease